MNTFSGILVCKEGYTLVDGSCLPCELGMYRDSLDAESCTPCSQDGSRTTEAEAATQASLCGAFSNS